MNLHQVFLIGYTGSSYHMVNILIVKHNNFHNQH